jgi:hypothetical protein
VFYAAVTENHDMHPTKPLVRLISACATFGALTSPALADPSPAVFNAILTTMAQPSYHLTMTLPEEGVVQGDFVKPGMMHMVMKEGESIVIGPTMYMKMGGVWKKYGGGAALMGSQSDVLKKMQAERADYSSTDLGMRVVGGIPYHAYRLSSAKKQTTQTMFVDSSGRIGRIELGTTVMTLSNFGEHVSIRPPM